jgi:hypothetical protein
LLKNASKVSNSFLLQIDVKMIILHPLPEANFTCPECRIKLSVRDWYMPGMRTLADLKCSQCGREFYGDLPASHGLYYPMLLDRATGLVQDTNQGSWFRRWLQESYLNRVHASIGFRREEFRPLKHPILLNCLDKVYGHSLLKLLNAQYYLDHRPDLDLIILAPQAMRWMMPEGAAAVWTVDLPFQRGSDWNDWLASEIRQQLEKIDVGYLSVDFPHPHPEDYDIQRFTGVTPFPFAEWEARLQEQPVVTFIWREDRLWEYHDNPIKRRLIRKVTRDLAFFQHLLNKPQKIVIKLGQVLRETYPHLEFAVAGLGQPGGLPAWIRDLRTPNISEDVERTWCQQYSRSHVVIGVHGSNMLLPSAHAGAVVELVPDFKWGNLIQDILMSPADPREALCRYHFLPLNTYPQVAAKIILSLLSYIPNALKRFKGPWCDHEWITKA